MRSAVAVITGALVLGCGGSADPVVMTNPPRTNCPTQNLWEQQNGAWLQTHPRINLVFWGGYWLNGGLSEMQHYADSWLTLGNADAFYQPMQEYGIGTGTVNGVYNTNYNLGVGAISDTAIQQELLSEIANGQLPAADPNHMSMYVVMLPPGTSSLQCISNCVAYHSYIDSSFTYQLIQYYNSDLNIVIAHEIYESATDPDSVNGYNGGPGDTEVGDYCVGNPYTLLGFTIQKVWSENACQCIPAN